MTDSLQEFDMKITLDPLADMLISTKGLTDIDQADLSNEFATQAARYAYFAVICAEARANRDTAEAFMKRDHAEAFVFYKGSDEHIPDGSRTVTDGLANMLVAQDVDCIRTKNAHIEAERQFRIMDALVKTLEQRANMLISLGAQLRSEADMTGMIIKDNPGNDVRKALERMKK